jgi:simple sugar transport system ATP-binding protein
VGVEGSGQRELLRALAGRLAPTAGTLELPRAVGFVPEDRQHDALLLDFSLAENLALRDAGTRRGRMRWTWWADETRRLLAAFDVRSAGPTAPARALSGGNQQKLVLARELRGEVAALVVENPSRGLDIRATDDVHRRLRDARAAGTAVVVYSGDLDEVLLLADRVLVVHAGQVREAPAVDRDLVGRAMLGAS